MLRPKNVARILKKHCPSFSKTLPVVLENAAHGFGKCCP